MSTNTPPPADRPSEPRRGLTDAERRKVYERMRDRGAPVVDEHAAEVLRNATPEQLAWFEAVNHGLQEVHGPGWSDEREGLDSAEAAYIIETFL